jgi:hypothetical protein
LDLSDDPFLSLAVVARNDGYGGNFLERMQVFLRVISELSESCHSKTELVVTEWNPPENRKRLSEALEWPPKTEHFTWKIITVPKELHDTFPNHEKVPLFEWAGKNVAIRRSRGQFILATNPDVIPSRDLFSYISDPSNLDSQRFYRADRYDVPGQSEGFSDLATIETYCKSHWSKVNRSYGSFLRKEDTAQSSDQTAKRIGLFMRHVLHTNGSGDFLLMSSKSWNDLRGYPELPTIDHVDSVMCFIAGMFLKQKVLPFPLYHQEHSRDDQKGKPRTDFEKIFQSKFGGSYFSQNDLFYLRKEGNGKIDLKKVEKLFPGRNSWGLADSNLEVQEIMFGSGGRADLGA